MKSTISEVMHIPETLTIICHFFLPANSFLGTVYMRGFHFSNARTCCCLEIS